MYRRERGCLDGGGGGCIRGGGREGWRGGGERKGVVRQAMQTLCSGGNIRKALAHFPSQGRGKKKRRGFCSSSPSEQRTAFRAQTLQDVLDRSHA